MQSFLDPRPIGPPNFMKSKKNKSNPINILNNMYSGLTGNCIDTFTVTIRVYSNS